MPPDVLAALAEAKLHEERAWKLTSLIDRMLFATSPRGGKGNKSFGAVVQGRLRWLERGWPVVIARRL